MAQRLEDYYHVGNDFLTNRADTISAEKLVEKIRMGDNKQIKEIKQKQWLSPENPALWTGDFDDD